MMACRLQCEKQWSYKTHGQRLCWSVLEMLFNRLLLSNLVWVWLLNDKNLGLECRHSVVVSRKKYDEWKWYFFGVEICCPLYGSCVGRTKKLSFSILTFYLLTAQQSSHLLQCLLNVKVIKVNDIPCSVCSFAHLYVLCGIGTETTVKLLS